MATAGNKKFKSIEEKKKMNLKACTVLLVFYNTIPQPYTQIIQININSIVLVLPNIRYLVYICRKYKYIYLQKLTFPISNNYISFVLLQTNFEQENIVLLVYFFSMTSNNLIYFTSKDHIKKKIHTSNFFYVT